MCASTLGGSTALALSACAGSAGSDNSGGGAGFEFGAPQEEVDEVLADLDPVEIVYQAGAQSPVTIPAGSAHLFKEYVEERSGGRITVELVWGQAIAGYPEIDDALADGRVDLSFSAPIYKPDEYPAFNALATATAGMPNSVVTGEMIGAAALVDMAWDSPELLKQYEDKNLTPLIPMTSSGTYFTVCTQPGTTPDDWQGRQVRIASTAHHLQASNFGASPVSMEYLEMFEALQRGTVDCTMAQMLPSQEAGLLEVAKYVGYTSAGSSLSGRSAGALLAGTGYQELPLAYQQIIFDSSHAGFGASISSITDGNAGGIKQLKDAGGEISAVDPETDRIMGETNEQLLDQIEESGAIGSDVRTRADEAAEKWTQIVEDLGYEDGGGFEDMDEWYSEDEYDFTPFSERFFEDAMIEHRPS